MSCDVGVIGLGTMGSNVALLLAEKGLKVAVFNRSHGKVLELLKQAQEEGQGKYQLEDCVGLSDMSDKLKLPRKFILLLSHGKATDEVLRELQPWISSGDVIVDAGNEWFQETERRMTWLKDEMDVRFVGTGISGGYQSARHGASFSPGGTKEAYDMVHPILSLLSAKTDMGETVTYIGPRGSGHYVKMVHNGIEQGMMSVITEVYSLLRYVGNMDHMTIQKVIDNWRETDPLLKHCFLLDITSKIMVTLDEHEKTGKHFLLDQVVDKVDQDVDNSEGTGVWTSKEASEQHIPCPTITAALNYRYISASLDTRNKLATQFASRKREMPQQTYISREDLIEVARKTVFIGMLMSFVQGINLIVKASQAQDWSVSLRDCGTVWRKGCIISIDSITDLLIKGGVDSLPKDKFNLLEHSQVTKWIDEHLDALRRAVVLGLSNGEPMPSLSASLSYIDSFTQVRLPINLMEAQLDYFGNHKYERLDDPQKKPVHTEWDKAPSA